MTRLLLAWRDQETKSWFPIGRLTRSGGKYEFVYLRGAQQAIEQCGLRLLLMFPNIDCIYESDNLFPLFQNRAPSAGRDDYFDFVKWLNLRQSEHDPLVVLARTGGRRATDTFEVFPCPQPEDDGSYRVHFFVHGISHFGEESAKRIEQLKANDRLLVMWDLQNGYDSKALALRTADTYPGDRTLVGFCPRYFTHDWLNVLFECHAEVKVERLNPSPAPLDFRLLCSLSGCWPDGFNPCSGEEFQPIVESAHSAITPS